MHLTQAPHSDPIASTFRTYCAYTETKEMSPSALERYKALMNPTRDDDSGDANAWKELAKLNMKLGFDIGKVDFPQRATDTLLQKAGGRVFKKFENTKQIIQWLENEAARAHPPTSSLASQPIAVSFGENVKLFFLNMQSLLKDGHLTRQEPPNFWPWFIAVLQSLETHAGGGAHHVPTPQATSPHPHIPGHVAATNFPPHAIVYGSGQKCMLGFYYPGKNASIDDVCQVPFLGNFWPCPHGIKMTYKDVNGHDDILTFSNAEAAFQAFKFPFRYASDFQTLTGAAAFQHKNSNALRPHMLLNNKYQGYASNWHCMMDVLKCKFEQNPDLSEKLKKTHPCFLLEHNDACDRDTTWSDNCDGMGQNWLGLQLMLLRETIAFPGDYDKQFWHRFLAQIGNKQPGFPKTFEEANHIGKNPKWLRLKKEAYCAMTKVLGPSCTLNCSKKNKCPS